MWFVPAALLRKVLETEVPTDSANATEHAHYNRMFNHMFALLQAALCEPVSTLQVLLQEKTVQQLIKLLLRSTRSMTSLPQDVMEVFSAEPNPPPSRACVVVGVPTMFAGILKLALLVESTPDGNTAGRKVLHKLRQRFAGQLYDWPIWLPVDKNLSFIQLLDELNSLESKDPWRSMLDALGRVPSFESVNEMTWLPWELILEYLRKLPVVRANLTQVLNLPGTAPLNATLAKLSSDVRAILDKLLALQICPALPSPTSRQ
jgi:hypothetical protein